MQLASSSRRSETAAAAGTTDKSRQLPKKVGCMSGILYFLHRHHSARKRLPSPAGKRDSQTTVSPAPAPAPALHPQQTEPKPTAAAERGQKVTRHKKRVSRHQVIISVSVAAESPGDHQTPSSNTKAGPAAPPADDAAAAGPRGEKASSRNKRAAAPPEAAAREKSTSHVDVPRSPMKPPALVARLMGLDDPPPPPPVVDAAAAPDHESAAEKRRKLLGALERCDEDLRALKSIIETLRVAESQSKAPSTAAGLLMDGSSNRPPATPTRPHPAGSNAGAAVEEKRFLDVDGEQPSPVSVLDALYSPPPARRPSNVNNDGSASTILAKAGNKRGEAAPPALIRPSQRPCPVSVHAGRRDKKVTVVDGHSTTPPVFTRNANLEAPPRGGDSPAAAAAFVRRAERPFSETYYSELPWQQIWTTTRRPPRQRRLQYCSRAMEESVDQVWKDGVWEERWELGKVAVGLEADILGDLVADVVKELGFRRCSCRLPLPLDACRKRLVFF